MEMFGVTDIAQVIETVSGYWDAALVVGVAILLFVLGRKVAKKLYSFKLGGWAGFSEASF